MLRDLANREEVLRASESLLRLAEVGDRLPTPVDDLIAAAGLHRGEDDLFAAATIDEAPSHLRKAIAALSGKVHAVLDRRRRQVYVNPEITHSGRRAFRALHEVGHDILPSQNKPAHADDRFTLSWQTKVRWERDANQTAAELLFQRERFTQMAAEYEVGMASVTELTQKFGGSLHSGLRRYVEFHRAPIAAVVLDLSPIGLEPEVYHRREAICSPAWEERFERPDRWPTRLDASSFGFVEGARRANLLPLVEWEGRWPDREDRAVRLKAEIVSNSYQLFVMIWRPQRETLKRRRRLVLPNAA